MRSYKFFALLIIALSAAACGTSAPVDNGNDQPPAGPDWTTYQANTSHTGYIPVTLNPGVFIERYRVLIKESAVLNPVAVIDDYVYVSVKAFWGYAKLTALRAPTGAVMREHDFGDIQGVHPAAYNKGKVYVTTSGQQDSYLYAFSCASGVEAFRSSYGNQWGLYYAPAIYGDNVYMGGGEYGGVYAFSGANGQQLWFTNLNQYDEWTPAVDEQYVYAYTGLDDPKLSVLNRNSGRVEFEIPDPHFSWEGWSMNEAPVLGSLQNILAVNGGRLISFDLTGRTIGYEIPGGFYGQVSAADGTIYVMNEDRVEARNEADGALLWSWLPPSWRAPMIPKGTMIVTDNLLLVSCEATIFPGSDYEGITCAVNLQTHQTDWTYGLGGCLALSAKGILFVATRDGLLAAVNVK